MEKQIVLKPNGTNWCRARKATNNRPTPGQKQTCWLAAEAISTGAGGKRRATEPGDVEHSSDFCAVGCVGDDFIMFSWDFGTINPCSMASPGIWMHLAQLTLRGYDHTVTTAPKISFGKMTHLIKYVYICLYSVELFPGRMKHLSTCSNITNKTRCHSHKSLNQVSIKTRFNIWVFHALIRGMCRLSLPTSNPRQLLLNLLRLHPHPGAASVPGISDIQVVGKKCGDLISSILGPLYL